jgi:hypothetical protein
MLTKVKLTIISLLAIAAILSEEGCNLNNGTANINPSITTPVNPTSTEYTSTPYVTPTTSYNTGVTGAPSNRTISLTFNGNGHTTYGDWAADVSVNNTNWLPGAPINIQSTLTITDAHV